MPSRNYKDLIAWQKAMDLAVAVYALSAELPQEERFGLVAQMRRAAASVPANIAEGEGRHALRPFLYYLSIAHGSLRELETHVMLAERLQFVSTSTTARVMASCAEVGRLVNGLTNSLEHNKRNHP